MNFQDCVSILSTRNDPSCSCSFPSCNLPRTTTNSQLDTITPSNEILQLSDLELVNLLTSFQGERVQSYSEYNNIFLTLVETSQLSEYPFLCAEITSRFAAISNKIREIKDILIERKLTSFARNIEILQKLEKEKLAVIAASHLDIMQAKFNLFKADQLTLQPQPEYISSRVKKIEEGINDVIDTIQADKVDLV